MAPRLLRSVFSVRRLLLAAVAAVAVVGAPLDGAALELKKELVTAAPLRYADLFVNPGAVKSRALERAADVLPEGRYYLSRAEINARLAETSPALADLDLRGEGVTVFVTAVRPENPLAAMPVRPEFDPVVREADAADDDAGPGSALFCFEKRWERAVKVPRGTPVTLVRQGDSVTVELKGVLTADWDRKKELRVRLVRGGQRVTETPKPGSLVWY